VELDELRLCLNNMCGQGNFGKVCTHHEHEVCAPYKVLYEGTTSLWESIFCLKSEFDQWYKKECLYGNCKLMVWESCFFVIGTKWHRWSTGAMDDTPPSSLMDSTVSLKVKTMKGKELGHTPWLAHFEGRRACWSFRMGLGRLKSKSINHTDLYKPNNKLVSV
jgi:hypothetical protein